MPSPAEHAEGAGPDHDRQPGRTGLRRWTLVPAAQLDVWRWVTTPEGINDEIRPVLRMTVPRALRGVSIDDLEPGPVGRSWFLLGGIVPVDFDAISLEVIDGPRSFREHSHMLTFSDWIHERRVRRVTDTVSLVEDRVSWVGRGPVNRTRPMRWLQRRGLTALFGHRHRRLVRHFAPSAAPEAVEGGGGPAGDGWSGAAATPEPDPADGGAQG